MGIPNRYRSENTRILSTEAKRAGASARWNESTKQKSTQKTNRAAITQSLRNLETRFGKKSRPAKQNAQRELGEVGADQKTQPTQNTMAPGATQAMRDDGIMFSETFDGVHFFNDDHFTLKTHVEVYAGEEIGLAIYFSDGHLLYGLPRASAIALAHGLLDACGTAHALPGGV